MPTETEISYLAALIDGEGFIGIDSSYKRRFKNQTYQVRIGVCNTKRKLLDWIKLRFGGSVLFRGKPKSPKHSPSYEWRIQAKKAGEIIRLVYPYLILKREQAKIALEFRDTFKESLIYTHQKGRFSNTQIKSTIIKKRKELREKMLALNKRGPK